jgi:hypothetical protein
MEASTLYLSTIYGWTIVFYSFSIDRGGIRTFDLGIVIHVLPLCYYTININNITDVNDTFRIVSFALRLMFQFAGQLTKASFTIVIF